MHVYEVRPRKDHRGVDPISDALPFGRLWYGEPNAISNAIDYAKHRSRSHDGVIRVYDDAGNVIETHEHAGDFKENMDAGRMGSISWRRRMEGRRQHEIAKETGHASIGADAEKSRAHSGLARFACNMGASR